MRLYLAPSAGVCCCRAADWTQFQANLALAMPPALATDPYPALLPSRESRRTPLYGRLALEVATQACASNSVDTGSVASVFSSAIGDAQITDYMCREVAADAPVLSPTRFHNSVHNSASGYWSIGAANSRISTAIAAGEFTFSAGLLEAALIAVQEDAPTLLVTHDIAVQGPLDAVYGEREPFAAAILLSHRQYRPEWRPLDIDLAAGSAAWSWPASPWLETLARQNDSARGSALLEMMALNATGTLTLPLGSGSRLCLTLHAG
jgi:hypothetical protein